MSEPPLPERKLIVARRSLNPSFIELIQVRLPERCREVSGSSFETHDNSVRSQKSRLVLEAF
jgi:hypothetical protein